MICSELKITVMKKTYSTRTTGLLTELGLLELRYESQLLEISRRLATLGIWKYSLGLHQRYAIAANEIIKANYGDMHQSEREGFFDLLSAAVKIGSGGSKEF